MTNRLECVGGQLVGGVPAIVNSVNGLDDNLSNASKAATVSLFGSSSSFSQRDTNRNDSVLASSAWAYVIAMLGDSINVTNYAGIGGNNSQQLLDRLQTDILDKPTDWVFGQIGVNDFYGFDFTAETVFANVSSIITQIIANGSKVVWLNCNPQNIARSGFTAEKSLESARYNRMLSDWERAIDGLTVVDMYSDGVNNRDFTNGAAKANVIGSDNIHFSLYGSWRIGVRTLKAISNHLKPNSNVSEMSPLTTGDYGTVNMSNFNGTGGLSGTGTAGIVPDDWELLRQSGEGTITGQIAEDRYQLSITKSTPETSDVYRLRSTNISSLFSGGENVRAKVVLDFDFSVLELEELRVYMFINNTVDPFITVDWGRSYNGFNPLTPMSANDLQIDIAPVIMQDAPTDVRITMNFRMRGAGTGTVTLKNLRITDV